MEKGIPPQNSHVTAIALLLVAGFLCWLFFAATTFTGITENDGYAYAASARSFLRGEGLLWDVHMVQSFSHSSAGQVLSRDGMRGNRRKYVLYPLLLAPFVAWIGESDLAILPLSVLFFLATIPLVYLLGARLFGRRAGFLAGILFILNSRILYYTISGMPFFLFTFLLVAAVLFIVTGKTRGGLFATGLFLGLLWLTKSVGMVIAATLLVYAAVSRWRDFRWHAGVVMAAGWLLVFGVFQLAQPVLFPPMEKTQPRFIENEVLPSDVETGSKEPASTYKQLPWHMRVVSNYLNTARVFSKSDPGHTMERSLDSRTGMEYWEGRWGELFYKILHNAWQVVKILFWYLAGPLLVMLFWVGGIFWLPHDERRRMFLLTALLLAVQGVVCSILFIMHRYFHPFLPLMIVLAAGLIDAAARRISPESVSGRRLVTAGMVVIVLLVSYPFCITAGLDKQCRVSDPFCARAAYAAGELQAGIGAFIRDKTEPDQVVACDAPFISWWHGDRTSIWLPVDMENLQALQDRAQVDWLLVTFRYWRNMEFWKQWVKDSARSDGTLDGFRFAGAYKNGDHVSYLYRSLRMERLEQALPNGEGK